jgi:hypothetical protein
MATESELSRRVTRLERELEKAKRSQWGFTHGDVFGTYMMLPALRGFWPFSSISETGQYIDMSYQGRHLLNQGATPRGNYRDNIPTMVFNGTSQYLYRADEAGLDITGNISLGGWFKVSSNTALMGLMTKEVTNTTNNDRNFGLYFRGDVAGDPFQVQFFNGTTMFSATSTVVTEVDKWYFVVARYTANIESYIYVSGVQTQSADTIPATINNSPAAFNIGVRNSSVNYFHGSAALCFICAGAVPIKMINRLYSVTRTYFDL